ncbi:MAG: arginyl-tRNA synthetase [Fusobacteria bacterium]|nr:MAG: arginyl-tRNA synthetase [Fusobacteriota bacterium]KAF0228883.1 MAG: arginyl-tRNA [Fusobacteriota bacterium]
MGIIIDLEKKIKENWRKGIALGQDKSLLLLSEIPSFTLEVPKDKKNGDYATNIAMVISKSEKKNPRELAGILVDLFKEVDDSEYISKIEIAGPGFINMYLTEKYLGEIIKEAIDQKNNYGHNEELKGEKINLEFVSANPTGLLHMGNARGAAIGDTLANVFKALGAEVIKEYYINDAGNQIENFGLSLDARFREALGEKGVIFPENGYHGADIMVTVKGYIEKNGTGLINVSSEERIATLIEYSLSEKLDHIKTYLGKFGLVYDVWYRESTIHNSGAIEETMDTLKEKGYLYENEGAIWLKTTSMGEEKDEVMIRNNGHPTYFAADIAYHKNKYDRGFNRLINIWGADHHGHVARMKRAMEAIGYSADGLEVILMQLVRLYKNGEILRMSKRTGTYVTLEELLEEVGKDAARYFFVMRNPDSHLDFDMDLAKSDSADNPVFYIQYAYARISSILRQIGDGEIDKYLDETEIVLGLDIEKELALKIGELEKVLIDAGVRREPYRVAAFALELATLFHQFYSSCRVLNEEEHVKKNRLKLIIATKYTLENVLGILGVSAPERM